MRPSLFVVCLLVAACGPTASPVTPAAPLASYTAERGDLDVVIAEEGSLKSAKAVVVRAAVGGKVLSLVKEGAEVQAGEVLMTLESKDLTTQQENTRIDIELATRTLADAEADAKLYELEAGKLIADAERTLRFAKLAQQQYEEGKAPLQERTLELAVRRAENERTDADEKLARMPELLDKGFVTPAEARTAQLEADEKQSGEKSRRRELEIFLQFERPQEQAKLQADVDGAVVALERARQQTGTVRNQKAEAIHRAKVQLDKKRKSLAEIDDRLAKLELRAPAAGVVVYGDPERSRWEGPATLEIGTDINQNRVVMSLPDLRNMIAVAEVNELNVARVQPGQPASVTVDSLGRTFAGTVLKVNTTASQEWGQTAKKYLADIALSGTEGAAFRPGMSCRVEIRAAQLPQVVHIPVDAVTVRQGQAWVWVAGAGGAPQRRTVELGQATNERVVIAKGLEPGERVLVLATEPETAPAAPAAPVQP
jgi:multidrug resistance efflux pump